MTDVDTGLPISIPVVQTTATPPTDTSVASGAVQGVNDPTIPTPTQTFGTETTATPGDVTVPGTASGAQVDTSTGTIPG